VTEGRVLQVWRWPVKSMAGEQVRAMRVDGRGAGGDRTHAVEHEHKGEWKPLTAREAPGMLAWRAAYPFAPDGGLDPEHPPYAVVTGPDGHAYAWDDPRLRDALARDLGRDVRLRRDVNGIQDLERSLLITSEATRVALAGELGRELDLRRVRPNFHLQLDGAAAVAEHGWEGATLHFEGGVVVRLLHPCERCAIPTRDPDTQVKLPELLRHLAARHDTLFGINARVLQSGRIAAGEAVRIEI
jgi:uncharacterized protein YcbX